MKKMLKSKLVWGALCLLLAGVLSFILLPRLYENELATTYVMVAKDTLKEGTKLTEDMIAALEVGAYGLPDSVITDAENAVGMIVNSTIYAGEYLQSIRLTSPDEEEAIQFELAPSDEGYTFMTISLPSASAGVASVLEGGSLVDIYAYTEDETATASVGKVLSGIYIQNVLNSDLRPLSAVIEENGNIAPAYIVVKCNEAQIKTLIALERAGSMHLTMAAAAKGGS